MNRGNLQTAAPPKRPTSVSILLLTASHCLPKARKGGNRVEIEKSRGDPANNSITTGLANLLYISVDFVFIVAG